MRLTLENESTRTQKKSSRKDRTERELGHTHGERRPRQRTGRFGSTSLFLLTRYPFSRLQNKHKHTPPARVLIKWSSQRRIDSQLLFHKKRILPLSNSGFVRATLAENEQLQTVKSDYSERTLTRTESD